MNNTAHPYSKFQQFVKSHGEKAQFAELRKETFEILKSYDKQKVSIPKRTPGKNCDIIIKDSVSLKDFLRKNYSTPPRFYPEKKFEYRLISGGMGGKEIGYMPKLKYGFYFLLFHESAHAAYHKEGSEIKRKHKKSDLGEFVMEKYTWEKAVEMLDLFKEEHDIDLLGEFTSQHEIHQYMDAHLTTYTTYKIAQQVQDLFFTLQEEKVA